MSRFMKIAVALLAIATVAAPAFAEDRLSLSGEMRVRHFYMSEYDFDDSKDSSFDAFDQRLRIAGKISVAEGVSVNFRTDITENSIPTSTGAGSGRSIAWAEKGQYTQRWSGQSWDKAYLQIDKEIFSLMAGQQYVSISPIAAEHIGTGFTVVTKGPVQFYLNWTKLDENDSLDNELANSTDTDFYGGKVSHKTDAYSADVFFATIQGGDGGDNTAYLTGLSGAFNIDAIKIKGEFDYFTGENNTTTDMDYVGAQLYLDGSMAIDESVTVGLIGLYAMGTDKSDETQLTRLTEFGGWQPQLYGPYTTDFQSEGTLGNDIFDITGSNGGIIAGELYTSIKLNDDMTMTGSFLYGVPEEDQNTDIDSVIIANVGLVYQIAGNTTLESQINIGQLDVDNNKMNLSGGHTGDDMAFGIMNGLFVKF